MKKLALFDIDRTVAEGSIGVLLVQHLMKKGLFPKKDYQRITKAIKLNDAGKINFTKRGELIIKSWANGLKGLSKSQIEREAREFFETKHKKEVYPGARQLVEYLKRKNYFVVGISRAFEEVLEPLGKYLKLNHVVGTRFEYKNGICTGNVLNQMWKPGAKEKELMNIFSSENLTTYESMAFGDTEDDYYMLKFVEYPITVNANKKLEKIATQKYWPIYNDLSLLLEDIKSGRFMPKIDWFGHYSRKYDRIIMNEKMLGNVIENDGKFIAILKKYAKPNAKVLEAGCGLGRTAVALSLAGYRVTAIDNDKGILRIARINCFNFGSNIRLMLLDFFDIDKRFKKWSFGAVTHEGVLEHFSDNQMKIILDKQLKVAPVIVFSVPVKSKRNDAYFKRDHVGHRNLWSKRDWVNFLKGKYSIKQATITPALRKDDLVMVIGKK